MSEAPDRFDPYHKWLGIGPDEQPPTLYCLLGARLFEPDLDAIANCADRQMSHVRTFATGPHSAISQKLLNEISAARICLLNPAKKAEYDARLREKDKPDAKPPVVRGPWVKIDVTPGDRSEYRLENDTPKTPTGSPPITGTVSGPRTLS